MTASLEQQLQANLVFLQLSILPRPFPDRWVENDIDSAITDMRSICATPSEWDEEAAGWAIETAEGTVYDATNED